MANIKMQCTSLELVKAKFIRTATVIAGYEREALGEVRDYSVECVRGQMTKIRQAFDADLAAMAQDITTVRFEREDGK